MRAAGGSKRRVGRNVGSRRRGPTTQVDRARTGNETVGELKGSQQADAATFEATETFVDTRTLFGLRIDAAPKNATEISSAWRDLALDKKRARKQRVVLVDGAGTGYGGLVPVLAANDYGAGGESSVFDRELAGEDKASFAVAKRRAVLAGRDYAHDEACLACRAGGARKATSSAEKKGAPTLRCRLCPTVMHRACAVGDFEGKHMQNGAWHCPQHACATCGRTTAAAGGLIFRCEACPRAFCEDCVPSTALVTGESRRRLARGAPSQPQACYVRCSAGCKSLLASDDATDDAALIFAPLDLDAVDVANRELFDAASKAVGAGEVDAEAAKARAEVAGAAIREALVECMLDVGAGHEAAADGAPRLRTRLFYLGSRWLGPAGGAGGGARGAARTVRDVAARRVGETSLRPRDVALAFEALVEKGELILAPGETANPPEQKHDARYDAGPELAASCAALRAARSVARIQAAATLAARIGPDLVEALLYERDAEGAAPPTKPIARFDAAKMCRCGYDCRGKPQKADHVCFVLDRAAERARSGRGPDSTKKARIDGRFPHRCSRATTTER